MDSSRNTQSLNGAWIFWKDPHARLAPDGLPQDGEYRVQVPAPWQSQAEDLRSYTGVGWYQRRFDLPADWIEERSQVLCFGAVDYHAQVWVNGKPAGEHEGGYLPFELDVTGLLQAGDNILTVRVADRLEDFAEIPHGKQSWYGPISGIWQDVWVESRPPRYLKRVRITPRGEQVHISVQMHGALAPGEGFGYEVRSPAGKVAAGGRSDAPEFTIDVPQPKLWSPETPHLYTLQVRLEGNQDRDILIETFGFRTIETREGQILLNGKPIYLRGALDQDYYPELIYTPPSMEYLEAQLRQAKALGLNCMRVHIKIADPRYYAAADRVGILIWTELPNWKDLTEASRRRGRETLEGMLERDWNHPSIIIWTIINENWGTDLTHNPAHRTWVSEMYHFLKSEDPLRLVVDNSACYANYHVVTDIEDYHNYYVQPDHYQEWRSWVDGLATRPCWTFVPELEGIDDWRGVLRDHWNLDPRRYASEVQRRGDEPLIVSEFGNWGLPDVEKLRACYGGQDPWWFQTGYNWGDGVVFPHGVDQRFEDYHLRRVFSSLSDLSRASQELQFEAMKYEIEQMRRHPSIQGYVITEFTDLHWECNGLLDMCRNPKSYYERFQTINTSTVIVPEWERLAFYAGETCQVIALVAHHDERDLAGSRLHWRLEEAPQVHGELGPLDIPAFGVSGVGTITFQAPEVESPRRMRLLLTLVDHDSVPVAINALDFAIFPPAARPDPAVKIYAPEFASALKELGYVTAGNLSDAALVITPQLTQAMYRHAQAGGQVLWLAESDPQPSPLSLWQVKARGGTHWQGDWASSFSWIAGDGPFQELPGHGAVDFLYAGITPDHVITGVSPDEFAHNVHAGMFVGWLQHNAALAAERRLGEGRLFISTFQLSKHWKFNPMAAAMLAGMVDHLAKNK